MAAEGEEQVHADYHPQDIVPSVHYQPYTEIFWGAPGSSMVSNPASLYDGDTYYFAPNGYAHPEGYYADGSPRHSTSPYLFPDGFPNQAPVPQSFSATTLMTPPGSVSPTLPFFPTHGHGWQPSVPASGALLEPFDGRNYTPADLPGHPSSQNRPTLAFPLPTGSLPTNPEAAQVETRYPAPSEPVTTLESQPHSVSPSSAVSPNYPTGPQGPFRELYSSDNRLDAPVLTSNTVEQRVSWHPPSGNAAHFVSPSPVEPVEHPQYIAKYYTPPRSLAGDSGEESEGSRLYGLQCRKRTNGHPHVACYHCKHRKMKCDPKVFDKDGRPWCQPCIDRCGPCYWPDSYHKYIMEDHAAAVIRHYATLPEASRVEPGTDTFDPSKCYERTSWTFSFNAMTGRNEFDDAPQLDIRRRRKRSRMNNWWDVFSGREGSDGGKVE